jgi:hypothetical protein
MTCCLCSTLPMLRFEEPRGAYEVTNPPPEVVHSLKDQLLQCRATEVLAANVMDVLFLHQSSYHKLRVCINGYEPYASPAAIAHLQKLVAPRDSSVVFAHITSTSRIVRCDVFLDRRCQRSVASEMLAAGFGIRLKEQVFIQGRPLRDVNETHAVLSFKGPGHLSGGGRSARRGSFSLSCFPSSSRRPQPSSSSSASSSEVDMAAQAHSKSRRRQSPESSQRFGAYNFQAQARTPPEQPSVFVLLDPQEPARQPSAGTAAISPRGHLCTEI